MTARTIRHLALTIFLLTLPGSVSASADLEAKLPRSWAGTFRWYSDTADQRVEIKLVTLSRPDPSHLEGRGCGRYQLGNRVTSIAVRMRIDVPTLGVEIWELDPTGRDLQDFVVDGSHRGQISEDLRDIFAQWTTTSTGQKGQLHLHAAPDVSCADESA